MRGATQRFDVSLLGPLFVIVSLSAALLGQDQRSAALTDAVAARPAYTAQSTAALATQLSLVGSMPQIASAGGWETTLTLVNFGASASEAKLNFYASDGSTTSWPFTFPQQPSQGTVQSSTVDRTLNPGATLVVDTTGPATQTALVGSSQLLTDGSVGGFAIFKYLSTGQQAVVPLETRSAPSYLLAFDETRGIQTGLALANLSATAGRVKVVVRDDSGALIPAKVTSIQLVANGHASFMLTDLTQGFPEIVGKRGTVEFDTPAGGRISVLGIRVNGKAITTLPVLAQVGTSGGALAHIATGGGWETGFTLVNTGSSSAQFTLSFSDEKTGVGLPLGLIFPQSGAAQTSASVTQTLAAGASLLVQTHGGNSAVTCSAHLTTTGNVGGFAIFNYGPWAQEAVVPLEIRSPGAWVLAFDNTGHTATGLALANLAEADATVPVIVRDDSGATLIQSQIQIAAHGHISFMLTDTARGYPVTSGKRGTIEFQTPTAGHINAIGLRVVGGGTNVITTIPVLAATTGVVSAGGAVAERALAQTGLSVALASNVLMSQMSVVFGLGRTPNCVTLDGGGSMQSADGSSVTKLYFDSNCAHPYIVSDATITEDATTHVAIITETANYYGVNGVSLGSMDFHEAISAPSDSEFVLYGQSVFTPASGSRTPVQLGLYCDVLAYATTLPCVGAVAQDFPALGQAIGAVTSLTLTAPSDGSSVAFRGGGSVVTGPLGGLEVTHPSMNTYAISGGTNSATTTASGSAGALALFPPMPTGWTLNDAAHDLQFQITVIDDTTRNLTIAITLASTGKTLATGAVDKSGTGSITYSDASTSAITSWTLAN